VIPLKVLPDEDDLVVLLGVLPDEIARPDGDPPDREREVENVRPLEEIRLRDIERMEEVLLLLDRGDGRA